MREICYVQVARCPGCNSVQPRDSVADPLFVKNYVWNNEHIPTSDGSVIPLVYKCTSCGLYFKNIVPDRDSVRRLIGETTYSAWRSSYEYKPEARLIRRLVGDRQVDILDVGAGHGGFLSAVEEISRRLSALDIVSFPDCADVVRNEYITGFLDDECLSWSNDPYDLVTLYDVIEHLYDVRRGFNNIAKLVRPGGHLIIETGNADSQLPRGHGAGSWWYMNFIEHHVAFTPQSLHHYASQAGFKPVMFMRKRQKDRKDLPLGFLLKGTLKSFVYKLLPNTYLNLAQRLGYAVMQPAPLLERDHMLLVLRRDN